MDRVHGATEAAAFVRRLDFPPAPTSRSTRPSTRRRSDGAPLRYGMVGGGRDAFIGAVHRKVVRARRAGRSSWPAPCRPIAGQGARLGGATSASRRPLLRHLAGAARGRARAAGGRPHRLRHHRDAERRALPGREGVRARRASTSSATSRSCTPASRRTSSCERSRETGVVFGVTYNYTGYPLVREARDMVRPRRPRHDPQGHRGVQPGLARDAARARPATSRPTGAPTRRARGVGRRDGRHRLARREPGDDHHRPARSPHICADLATVVRGPAPGRRRQPAAALRGRRPRRADRVADRRRPRERGLRIRVFGDRGSLALAAGGSEHDARTRRSASRPAS